MTAGVGRWVKRCYGGFSSRLREQFPDVFQDLCLYSEVSALLSTYSFHLPARRFIQELFQDIKFEKVSLIKELAPCCVGWLNFNQLLL